MKSTLSGCWPFILAFTLHLCSTCSFRGFLQHIKGQCQFCSAEGRGGRGGEYVRGLLSLHTSWPRQGLSMNRAPGLADIFCRVWVCSIASADVCVRSRISSVIMKAWLVRKASLRKDTTIATVANYDYCANIYIFKVQTLEIWNDKR